MSPDNATYPPHFHMERTSMLNLTLISKYKPHDATLFRIDNPLPGSWFAAGYLPNWDQPVQQEVRSFVSIIFCTNITRQMTN